MNGYTQLQIDRMVFALRGAGWFVLSPDNEMLKALWAANEELEKVRGLEGQNEALNALHFQCQVACHEAGVLK